MADLTPARRIPWIACVTALLMVAPAYAGDQPTATPSAQQAAKADLYDIDSSDTDVRFVFEALARSSGANIVVSPDVKGNVTAHLKQFTVEQILDHLSTVLGFAWKKTDSAYLVAPKEKLEPPVPKLENTSPEIQSLVWKCKHIKVSDVVRTIQELFPKLKIVEGPDPVTPALGTPGSGVAGGAGGGYDAGSGGSPGGTSQTGGGKGTSLVMLGDPGDIAKAREILTQLDEGRPQVFIKVAITEVNSSAKDELGVTWSYSDLIIQEAARGTGISFGKFTKQGMTFTGTISALIDRGAAKLLAEPNISVVDGESASILIGDRILFPKLIGYSQFGSPIYDKAEEQVGIYLQIAARVVGSDRVLLTLYPQVSLVTTFLKTQAGDYPQISTRESRTTVSVKSAETLAIGGLLRDDEIKSMSKIPLLGDLPIIGGLFRHTKTTRERNEIVILLTPVILSTN